MASVYSDPDYVAKLPKTGFSLYQPVNFSSIPGALVPTFCCDMVPGEKISGSVSDFCRTQELESPAMTDIDTFVDFFFIPAKKLYSIFGEWFFNIDDNPTALRPSVNAARVKFLPSVSPARIKSLFASENQISYTNYQAQGQGSFNPRLFSTESNFDTFSNGMVRLLAHMRFDVFNLFDAGGNSSSLWNIPLLPFLAYQSVYFDYYRDTQWQVNEVDAYNIDDWLTTLSQENITDARLKKIFQLRYRRQNADYYTQIKPSPLQNSTNMLNIDGVRENALLAVNDWLSGSGMTFNYGSDGNGNTNVGLGSGSSVPYPALSGDGTLIGKVANGDVRTQAVNVSWVGADVPSQPSPIDAEFSKNATYYSPLDANHNPLQYPSGSIFASLASRNVNSQVGSVGINVSNWDVIVSNLKQNVNTSAIRVMFALEKLSKITARAGKHYDDQVLAHFGYKVPKGVSNEVYYVGGSHGQIHIGEVISPSNTEGSTAGEMVGKGYGNISDGKVDFTAPCHGYFMAVYSSAPRRTYTPLGSPKEFSQFERQDFLQPELMDLGQQPLFSTEFNPHYSQEHIVGWQWRYMERKTRIPMAIGAFARYSDDNTSLNGVLQDWTIQYPVYNVKRGMSTYYGLSWENFAVNAQSFNSIMLLQWQPYYAATDSFHVARVFDRDPLFHDFKSDFYLTSYMSTFGEPKLF